jgi:hypothetical protein
MRILNKIYLKEENKTKLTLKISLLNRVIRF